MSLDYINIQMSIFIFGNPDLAHDSLPLKILPELKKCFPQIKFEVKDPNEEWGAFTVSGPEPLEELIIIDTAVGINKVTVFDGLEQFESAPRVSMHDFDALFNLRYLQKLGCVKKVKIIGIPPTISEDEAKLEVAKILSGF